MNAVATLIVKRETLFLSSEHAEGVRAALAEAGASPGAPDWLAPGIACDIPFEGLDVAAAKSVASGALQGQAVDFACQPVKDRKKALLIADMDSTMIQVECIDELADFAGLKPQVAAITEAAMQGELDFAGALKERVALLAGLTEDVLAEVYRERVVLTPGAETLVRSMGKSGAHTILVSGGFTYFVARVAEALGFADFLANRLEMEGGQLTGQVTGQIVDGAVKRQTLLDACAAKGIAPADALAVGDGANDIPMMAKAGLSAAYRGKPKARAAADITLDHADLSGLLYVQGYRADEILEAS